MKSLVLIAVVGLGLVLGEVRIIDMTHTFGHKTVYYPGNPPFNFSLAFEVVLENTVAVSYYFQTAEHSGTHIDAPRHFCPQGKRVHEIPMDKLSGPGVVLDFRSQAEQNYDYQVSLQDIKDWEAKHGLIPKEAIVLLNFGWAKFWPNLTKVFNSADVTNTTTFHWPGLGIEASRYLSGTRKIHAVGHDTPSTDFGQTRTFPVHINLLCEHEVIILENVANLNAMPTTGSHVYIGAIKLENGSGTPARLFATVDDSGDPSGAGEITLNGFCVSLLFIIMVILSTESLVC